MSDYAFSISNILPPLIMPVAQVLETRTDSEELTEKNDRRLWEEIVKESDDHRQEIEDYIKLKNGYIEPPQHPEVEYLNQNVFPILNQSLVELLTKARQQEMTVLTEGDIPINPLNFISEYIYNMNPLHPDRQENWNDIHEVHWTPSSTPSKESKSSESEPEL